MKIAILDDYQRAVSQLNSFKILGGKEVKILNETIANAHELAKELEDIEILVLIRERTKITEELLSLLPNLKLISQTGKISNHLDLATCTKYRVAVAEGIGSPTAPAELTWNLIMNVTRQIPQAILDFKAGKWQTNIGTTISGQTIGIWGYGKIGKKIAQYAKVFDANVQIWGSESSRKKAIADGFKACESKEEFFQTSDVISIHLRLNDSTKGIVKKKDLLMMKPTASIVNTARAELFAKNALIEALNFGRPGFAAIDVFETEPLYNVNHHYLTHPKIIATPHLGYVEQNSYELYFEKAFENVINFIHHHPTNIANPEVLQ